LVVVAARSVAKQSRIFGKLEAGRAFNRVEGIMQVLGQGVVRRRWWKERDDEEIRGEEHENSPTITQRFE